MYVPAPNSCKAIAGMFGGSVRGHLGFKDSKFTHKGAKRGSESNQIGESMRAKKRGKNEKMEKQGEEGEGKKSRMIKK